MDGARVESLDEAQAHIDSLRAGLTEAERRLTLAEDWIDTYLATPRWKRLVFRIDGWPAHRLVREPAWRPWRRWWRS